jgi:hypothetical protein
MYTLNVSQVIVCTVLNICRSLNNVKENVKKLFLVKFGDYEKRSLSR